MNTLNKKLTFKVSSMAIFLLYQKQQFYLLFLKRMISSMGSSSNYVKYYNSKQSPSQITCKDMIKDVTVKRVKIYHSQK